MKRILMISFLILATFVVKADSKGKGMKFFHGTYEELLAEAKKQDKKVFMDFYTKWCGPCRAMAKNVFPLKRVGDFYNKHFICYKIDAEAGEGPALAKKYKVNKYPTFIFTDHNGEVIYEGSSIGAGDETGFLRLGRLALGEEEKDWVWYQEEFKKGNRETQFLNEYFKARSAAEGKGVSKEEVLMVYESYPEDERWEGKPLETAFWGAEMGNKFYQIVVDNKDKFPKLKDDKIMVTWISNLLYEVMDDEEKIASTFKTLKSDFPRFADQAMEFFRADKMRFEDKEAEQIVAIMKYIKKYGEPMDLYWIIGPSSIRAKELKPEHADYIRKVYSPGMNRTPVHFHSVASYCYLTYKAGKIEEAKEIAEKHAKEAEKYKDSKKSAWAYGVIQKMLNGEELVPLTFSKKK